MHEEGVVIGLEMGKEEIAFLAALEVQLRTQWIEPRDQKSQRSCRRGEKKY